MMEKNRSTLKKAIEHLPEYTPPATLWDKLAKDLDNKDTLSDGLSQLPGYSPPPQVWNAISTALEEDPKSAKVRYLQISRLMGIAAAGLLLLFAAFWLQREPAPKVALTYKQETISPIQITMDWDDNEPQFELVLQQLEQLESPTPSLNKLKLELEELNSAKQEVKVMLTAYGGRDPDLINQLGHIERERSAVYRELIKQI